jgi:hypothetical protein
MAEDGATNPTEECDRATTAQALPWTVYTSCLEPMGYMNSGNLISATARSPSSELSRSQESGGPPR